MRVSRLSLQHPSTQQAVRVYGRAVMRKGKAARALVAAKSQREAAQIADTSIYDIRKWWAVTRNSDDVALAMANQGTVVYKDVR